MGNGTSYNAFNNIRPEFANLNAAGDRAVGTYDYWGIAKEGGNCGNYKWILVGKSE